MASAMPPLPLLRLYPTLSRYIARQFLTTLLATLTILLGLVMLLDYIELLRRAGDSLPSSTLFTMAAFKAPQTIESLLPFAGLIGAMASLWRFTRTQELVVIRSVGVSVWQFLIPALMVVALVGVLEVTVINPLSATLYSHFEKMEETLLLHRSSALTLTESGLWLREPLGRSDDSADDSGAPTPGTLVPAPGTAVTAKTGSDATLVVHARSARQVGTELVMGDVSFYFTDQAGRFAKMMEAKKATLENNTMMLSDAWTLAPNRPGVHDAVLTLPTSLTIDRVQDHFASPETISFWRLPEFIAFFEAAGFSALRFRLQWDSLLASPLQLCAMVILATAFASTPNQRSGRGMARIAAGVGTGFVVFFFTQITQALGLSATMPLWLAAWAPTVATLLLATSALLFLEDG